MKKKTLITVFLLICFVVIINSVFAAPTDIGDTGVYTKPPAPVLPPAGGKYIDPTFGTEILRVTDRNDVDENIHAYSQYSPFNADSTRFVIRRLGVSPGPQLYSFDPVNFTMSRIGPLFSGMSLYFDSICWSHLDPSIMYGLNGLKLYQYAPDTKIFTEIKDFSGSFPSGLSYLTKSDNERWFSFIVGRLNNNDGVMVAYDKQTDTVYQYDLFTEFGIDANNLHSATIDKSGTYVYINKSGNVPVFVWNILANTVEMIPFGDAARPKGHRAMGTLNVYHKDVGSGSTYGGFIKRNLNDAQNYSNIFVMPDGPDYTQAAHCSLNHTDESYIFAERYFASPQTITRPYQDEIMQIWIDESSTTKVRRLAHHRTEYTNYWSSPRAASSIDGKFIMYESNWDGSPYIDVFILKVPPLPSGDNTPPAPPQGLEISS